MVAALADGATMESRNVGDLIGSRGNERGNSGGEGSRAAIDEALREAECELSCGTACALIVDRESHLILPADQVKARLDQSARAQQSFAR